MNTSDIPEDIRQEWLAEVAARNQRRTCLECGCSGGHADQCPAAEDSEDEQGEDEK
jgi:hypothetical protein